MEFLMEISFDKSFLLQRKTYYFEYKGIRFKLIQDKPGRWADHLLTIVPQYESPARDLAFSAASEFLSALAWESGGAVAAWDGGGRGWPDRLPLRRAVPCIYTFPRIPFCGPLLGQSLTQIPHIKTNEQQIALALFREAKASNNDYLSFLFFWQVLEVIGENPEHVVDNAFRKHRKDLQGIPSNIDNLPLADRSLGEYLRDDCRHAIAHIRRKPGKRKLDLDKLDDQTRLGISSRVLESLAKFYILNVLQLVEKLYLVRPRAGGFPRYIAHDTSLRSSLVLAYPSLPSKFKRRPFSGAKKRWV